MTSPAHDREYESLGDLLIDIAHLPRTDTLEAEILRARASQWAQQDQDPNTTDLLGDGDAILDHIHNAVDRLRSFAYGAGLFLAAGVVIAWYFSFGSESGL